MINFDEINATIPGKDGVSAPIPINCAQCHRTLIWIAFTNAKANLTVICPKCDIVTVLKDVYID